MHPYTVNTTLEMQQLASLGVDGMFTNFPDQLDQVLGKNAATGKQAAKQSAAAHAACRARL